MIRSRNHNIMVNLQKAMILHSQINTTVSRAKKCRPILEKAITLSKQNTLHARRQLIAMFGDAIAKKMITDVAPRFEKRDGGYTRIIKNGFRRGDCAPMAIFSFVGE